MMKQLAPLTATFVLATGAFAYAQQSSQQAPPPPPATQTKPDEKTETKDKADPKAPLSIAGKWTVSTEMQQGAQSSQLDLKLDGKKLTGTMSSQMGETPVTGEFADGKFKFSFSYQGQNGPVEIVFSGAMKDAATFEGNLEFGQGFPPIPFKGERVKEKL